MRSDFIGECVRFYGLPEAVCATQFLVPSLTRDQREEVIRKPLEQAGAKIAPALVELLLNDQGTEPDQLPVFQHCLLRVWEKANLALRPGPQLAGRTGEEGPSGPHLDVSRYVAIGGVAGALSQHAEEILNSVPGWERAVEQVFRALSEVDREGRATRRALPFYELVAETAIPEEEARRVVDRFRDDDCSFLVPLRSALPTIRADTRIDVGHEALLRRWDRISSDSGESLTNEHPSGWLWAEEEDSERELPDRPLYNPVTLIAIYLVGLGIAAGLVSSADLAPVMSFRVTVLGITLVGVVVLTVGAGALPNYLFKLRRHRDSFRASELVAKVPFCRDIGAPLASEIAGFSGSWTILPAPSSSAAARSATVCILLSPVNSRSERALCRFILDRESSSESLHC